MNSLKQQKFNNLYSKNTTLYVCLACVQFTYFTQIDTTTDRTYFGNKYPKLPFADLKLS